MLPLENKGATAPGEERVAKAVPQDGVLVPNATAAAMEPTSFVSAMMLGEWLAPPQAAVMVSIERHDIWSRA